MSDLRAADDERDAAPRTAATARDGDQEMKIVVSVIIIFLDGAPFIEEAIRSVVEQTFRQWELVLVDDGSSDGSSDIARRWAERDPRRVRYIDHPGHANLGMSASRNRGIAAARGCYIAFLDADDVWLPDKLDQQVAILEAAPTAGMVVGVPLLWYSWTGLPQHAGADKRAGAPTTHERLVEPPHLLIAALAGSAPSIWPSDVLMRREAVQAVGGFEECFRGMYEDQAFFSKLLLQSAAHVSTQTWLKYRQHENSFSSAAKRRGQRFATRRYYLTWLRQYLRGQSEVDPRVHAVVADQLRPHALHRRLGRRIVTITRRVVSFLERVTPWERQPRHGSVSGDA